jgi:hypothetical protein
MTTKLRVWNGAMVSLGHRRLVDTGEVVEAARELTAVWDQVVGECLAAGSWNFAMETVKATADTGVTPEFGFPEVFAKPSDWVRTFAVSDDEYFSRPLLHYYDDSTFWSAETSPIYVRYVSNDTGLGLDLTRWPAKFARYVELEAASRIAYKVTQSDSVVERMEKTRDKARREALNHDAMNEANPKFPPPSSWTVSRGGLSGRERGSRSNLTE